MNTREMHKLVAGCGLNKLCACIATHKTKVWQVQEEQGGMILCWQSTGVGKLGVFSRFVFTLTELGFFICTKVIKKLLNKPAVSFCFWSFSQPRVAMGEEAVGTDEINAKDATNVKSQKHKQTDRHTHTHTHTHRDEHMYTQIHTPVETCTYTHRHTFTRVHTHILPWSTIVTFLKCGFVLSFAQMLNCSAISLSIKHAAPQVALQSMQERTPSMVMDQFDKPCGSSLVFIIKVKWS